MLETLWEIGYRILKFAIDTGAKPTRGELAKLAEQFVREEWTARVMADNLDAMIKAAGKVSSTFDAKPSGDVPRLDIDIEIVDPHAASNE